MNPKTYLHSNVFYLRIKQGITRKELAEKIGVEIDAVIAIEDGLELVSMRVLMKIANIFSVDVDRLISVNLNENNKNISWIDQFKERLVAIKDFELFSQILQFSKHEIKYFSALEINKLLALLFLQLNEYSYSVWDFWRVMDILINPDERIN